MDEPHEPGIATTTLQRAHSVLITQAERLRMIAEEVGGSAKVLDEARRCDAAAEDLWHVIRHRAI